MAGPGARKIADAAKTEKIPFFACFTDCWKSLSLLAMFMVRGVRVAGPLTLGAKANEPAGSEARVATANEVRRIFIGVLVYKMVMEVMCCFFLFKKARIGEWPELPTNMLAWDTQCSALTCTGTTGIFLKSRRN